MNEAKGRESENPTHYEGKLIIGLTGNIATGKSAVMRLAQDKGALTIDADEIVHDLMNNDEPLQEAIAAKFSSRVRHEDGRIDREVLGQVVFSDPEAMQLLESLTHPAVRQALDQQILDSEAKIVMIEAIKLLEGNLSDSCHQIWVTRCDRQKQLERLRVCRGMETAVAAARIKAQSPQENKIAFADVVIDTDGLMIDTKEHFEVAWSRLPDSRSAAPKPRMEIAPAPDYLPRKEGGTDSANAGGLASQADENLAPLTLAEAPAGLRVRRARPSDIPSILLLIKNATDGAVMMKRTELLMALSDRGYFLGQVEADLSTVVGWNIDSQVGRVDEIYIHPPEMIPVTGTAVLTEIEKSANAHVCQIIVIFLPNNASETLRRLVLTHGYRHIAEDALANNWQDAIEESQPDDTFCMIKILRDTRKN